MRGIDVTLCVDVFTTIGLGFPEKIDSWMETYTILAIKVSF